MALAPFLEDVFLDPTFYVISILSAFAIGLLQGIILGKAILIRFPRLQNHAKIVSVLFFFLFLINALISVPRFASPEKIQIASIFEATNPGDLVSIVYTIFGVNTGFLAVLGISVTIMTLVLLKMTNIQGYAKVFVFFFSLAILIFTGISRFTDLTPSTFEVFLYFLYQLGITIGIVIGSSSRIKPKKSNLK